jgi:hypothetical protein
MKIITTDTQQELQKEGVGRIESSGIPWTK